MFFRKAVKRPSVQQQKRAAILRSLLRKEAVLGGTVFGPLPKGVRREFFCLDETTWVWHEEWTDKQGKFHVQNTRYDIRPDAILKAQNGHTYQAVSPQEARNLLDAITAYEARVTHEMYRSVT